MNYKQSIGLHIRFKENFTSIIKQAKKYKVKSFQFFLTDPANNNKYFKISPKEESDFLEINKQFSNLFIHCSYWINPASANQKNIENAKKLLNREIKTAKRLGIRKLILHAGTSKGHKKTLDDPLGKISGIKTLAKILNDILDAESQIEILLENTAHANQSIGSDLTDFALLKTMLNKPNNINFCLDVSHAFAYGYNIENINQFIKILDKSMGLEKIKLIHLNDSAEKKGSKIDKHEIPGRGLIGKTTLKNIINHPSLRNIPIIMELPEITEEKTILILNKINNWINPGIKNNSIELKTITKNPV